MKKAIASALGAVADFAFPRLCPLCGTPSDRPGRHVCWNCAASLDGLAIPPPACRFCGDHIDARLRDGLCARCRRNRPRFDMARSVFSHEGDARRLVHDLKYRRATWLANDLADFLEGRARAEFDIRDIDVILPVPLHPVKFVLRSYNQSALLASSLARRIGAPCDGSLLRRLRDTPTQTHLGAGGRQRNVDGAFGVATPEFARSRTILVVDDVMTTGATIDEIAKTLKAAGAWRVWALTLCRAERQPLHD